MRPGRTRGPLPPPRTPHLRIVNERWVTLLNSWYGVSPPETFSGGKEKLLEEIVVPGRPRWRPLLAGRAVREAPERVRLFRVDP